MLASERSPCRRQKFEKPQREELRGTERMFVALPDGQIITSDYKNSCQVLLAKISRFSRTPNQRYITAIPSRSEGRIMIATNVGRGAVDAGSADSERHESVR